MSGSSRPAPPSIRRLRVVQRYRQLVLLMVILVAFDASATDGGVIDRIDDHAVTDFFAPHFIRQVYSKAGDTLLWNGSRLEQLLTLIGAADTHGLNAADYLHRPLLEIGDIGKLNGTARIDADLTATEALLRFGFHIQYGKVDPLLLDAAWNYGRPVELDDPAAVVVRLIQSPDLTESIKPLMRHGPLYSRLRNWLSIYRGFAAKGGWQPVSEGPTLHPGDQGERVIELRTRLAAEGFVTPPDEPAAAQHLYDPSLEIQVKAWQERHGLEADGVVGAKTITALAESASALVDRLRINLERLRWAAPERQERALLVNIAGFALQLRDRGTIRWTSRVVVGKPYRQTPIFRAGMTHLVFNPDWTIPPTILAKDTLPAIRKDPGYLAKQHMDVVTASGKPVNPATIDWSATQGRRFPWLIRQRPGVWNALGQVKFIFPNEHFVFLHDTPSRDLFKQTERSFSSGCIRVADPLALAALLLEDQSGFSPAEIETLLATGETRTVFLKEPLPVLLQYLTAVEMEAGQFRFHRDIYKRDAKVLAALDAAAPEL